MACRLSVVPALGCRGPANVLHGRYEFVVFILVIACRANNPCSWLLVPCGVTAQ